MSSEPFSPDVLCVGHAAYDLIYEVDHHPGPDEKCFAGNFTACGGGPAANASVTVARLGGTSGFMGYLGEDLFGSLHHQELLAEGVNTTLLVKGRHPTPLSVILVKPNGARTVINYKGSTPFLEPGDLDPFENLPNVLLFDGHEPLISLPLAKRAREKGIPTVLDAGSAHRGTTELAPVVDYLVASAKFARTFTGLENPRQALSRLGSLSPCVVITLGKDGLLWKVGEKSGAMAAFAVQAMDTTGAGDTFHGAFALGVARHEEFPANLERASAAAALCCTKMGARPGIPNRMEVDRFLAARR